MPELPDVTVYVEHIARRVVGETLDDVRVGNPFVLQSVEPPLSAVRGRSVIGVERVGKRIALALDGELFLLVHLMIAGRLHWHSRLTKLPGRRGLVAFDFSNGTMILTEAGTKRRATLHVVAGATALRVHDRGGLDVMTASLDAFAAALTRENHTLKRSLTDPRVFDGIGNAYSDEILHAARLSPLALTQKMSDEQITRLHVATRETLALWIERLRADAGEEFPEKVTAFRPDMAVHGRFGLPCPVCAAPVQRIVYADNETNYCARCQTGGRLLADRALSRLLKSDWPRDVDDQ